MTKYDAFLAALLGFSPSYGVYTLALFDLFYKSVDGQRSHFLPEQEPSFGMGSRGDHSEQVKALRRLAFQDLGEKAADFDSLYAVARAELVSNGFFTEHPAYPDRFVPTAKTERIVPTVGEFAAKYVAYRDQGATKAELDAFQTAAEALATAKRADLLAGTEKSGASFFYRNAGQFPLMRRLDDDYKQYARAVSPTGFLDNVILSEAR